MKYFFIGLFVGIILQMKLNLDTNFWYSNKLKRGDKVTFKMTPEEKELVYKNCKISFITSQATLNSNDAFVLFENCESVFPSMNGTYTDILDLNQLKKVEK